MTTVGEFLRNGADDMWQRAVRAQVDSDHELAFWADERRLIRETVRLLRRCDDEITYRLTGERVLHGRFYDQARIKAEQERAGEYDDTYAVHTWDGTSVRQYSVTNPLETSLAESQVEAEQRRFDERQR